MQAALREHLFHSCGHARATGTDKGMKKTRSARLPKMRASLCEHLFHPYITLQKSSATGPDGSSTMKIPSSGNSSLEPYP